MRRYLLFSAACIAIILICLSVWQVSVVQVMLPKVDNRMLDSIRVGNTDRICLTYRHSVELMTVEGCFIVDPSGGFLAVQTKMESVGTGLPDNALDRTKVINGWIVVDEKSRPVGPIRFFIVPINQTRLTIAKKSIHIENLEAGTIVLLDTRRMSYLAWFFDTVYTYIHSKG